MQATLRRSLQVGRVLPIAVIAILLGGVAAAAQIYVDASNDSGVEDGTQASPFNTIQEGINAVMSGDEVIVAAGV